MIGSLTGNVVHQNEKYCILDVSGVGYKVFATPDTLEYAAASPNVFLFIHTIVREDALELFGFRDTMSLGMFEKLVSISGIGPRSALSVLALAGTEDLRSAIVRGDLIFLTKVSGIGKKTAEKILIELRDVLSKDYGENTHTLSEPTDSDVLGALESLGYTAQNIRDALKNIPKEIGTAEEKIKAALKYLAK